MLNNMMGEDETQPEREIFVQIGGKYIFHNHYCIIPAEVTQIDTLNSIIKHLKLHEFSHVDFFTYMIVAGSIFLMYMLCCWLTIFLNSTFECIRPMGSVVYSRK